MSIRIMRAVWMEVGAERERQISEEGWTPKHDDGHRYGVLAIAAARYAVEDTDATVEDPHNVESWIKPKGHRRNLIRAAALILAEIERLDRTEAREAGARV